jgi:hypothetical protein
MNNKAISSTIVNSLYVAHTTKMEKPAQATSTKVIETVKPSVADVEPYFYTGKSYSYDSNGGGYQGL